MTAANVRIKSEVILTADVVTNDSDKSFTVPAGSEWTLLSLRAELISTGTAGNRQMVIEIQDSANNVLMLIQAGAVQAASTTVNYNFAVGLENETSVVNANLNKALPAQLVLTAGMIIRVYDTAAVAAAADDMVVRFTASVREA